MHGKFEGEYGRAFRLDDLVFGDTYVVIRDADEFFRRLNAAVVAIGHQMQRDIVDYVDRSSRYTGPMGPFRKFSERAVDQEVRVVIRPGVGKPLNLRLGDLSDIAQTGPASDLLRLTPKGGSPNNGLQPTAAGTILSRRG